MITRALKGLEDVISVSVVHPTWQKTRPDDEADAHCGWVFRDESDPPMQSPAGYGSFPCAGCVPDDVCGATTVREIYDKVGYDGKKFTVPILFDKKTMKIVNNESSEIIRMLNAAFNEFCDEKAVPGARDRDLYPAELRGAIDAANAWIYDSINNGVYKCGFAQSQQAYDGAVAALFEGLERVRLRLYPTPD
jgi:putative glutathione S-transferase